MCPVVGSTIFARYQQLTFSCFFVCRTIDKNIFTICCFANFVPTTDKPTRLLTIFTPKHASRTESLFTWNTKEVMLTVWPDLSKFRHFGNILWIVVKWLRVYSLLGKSLNLLWQNCNVFGLPFNAVRGQILKNNVAILVTLVLLNSTPYLLLVILPCYGLACSLPF